jgi:uncharacterized protein YjbJ (UPF0337 family)
MSSPRQDETKGRIKESAGAMTNDDELKREGKRDQAAAGIKERVENAVDKVKDMLNDNDNQKDESK